MQKVILSEDFSTRIKVLEKHFLDKMNGITDSKYLKTENFFLNDDLLIHTMNREFHFKRTELTTVKHYKRNILFENNDLLGLCSYVTTELDVNKVEFQSTINNFDVKGNEVICSEAMQIKSLNISNFFKGSIKQDVLKDFNGLVMLAENYLNSKIVCKIDFSTFESFPASSSILDVLNFSARINDAKECRKFNVFVNDLVIHKNEYWRTIAYVLFQEVFKYFDREEFCNLPFSKIKEQIDLLSY